MQEHRLHTLQDEQDEEDDGFFTPNAAAAQPIIGRSAGGAEESEKEDRWTVASDIDESEIPAAVPPLPETPAAVPPLPENDERHSPEFLHMSAATEFHDDLLPDTEGAKNRRRLASCAARRQEAGEGCVCSYNRTPESYKERKQKTSSRQSRRQIHRRAKSGS